MRRIYKGVPHSEIGTEIEIAIEIEIEIGIAIEVEIGIGSNHRKKRLTSPAFQSAMSSKDPRAMDLGKSISISIAISIPIPIAISISISTVEEARWHRPGATIVFHFRVR